MRNGKNVLIFLLLIAVILLSILNCKDQVIPEVREANPPEEIISIEQAKEMYDAYSDRRVVLIQEFEEPNPDGSPFDATRYGWYDYATVKEYMAYIEQEAQRANVEISGLQFYFANYPDREVFENGEPVKFPRHNSFFLIPTLSQEGEHLGFMTAGSEDGERVAVLIRDRVPADSVRQKGPSGFSAKRETYGTMNPKLLMINGSFMNTADDHEDRSLILNESNLIPPPKQDTDMDN